MEEALSADFSFSGEAQRMERKAEKGTAFTHPVFMCLVGAPDLGSLLWHSPGLDTSLLKNHTMLPKTQQNSKEETGTLLAAGNA